MPLGNIHPSGPYGALWLNPAASCIIILVTPLPDEMETLEMEEDPGSFGGIKRNRKCTDTGCLFGMAAFFLIWFGILGYYVAIGDLDRIINGYDDCGNVCGKNNIKTDSIPFECFGKNMKQKKYLLYVFETSEDGLKKNVTKTCVENCNDHDAHVEFLNRCSPNTPNINQTRTDNLFQSLAEDFQICWKHIILLSFLALVFSIIMMVLMRYATAFLVWFVLICLSMILIGLSTLLWIYKIAPLNIMMTVVTVGVLLLIFITRKRIKLIIQLFKESAKVMANMPLLLFQPVMTAFVIFLIISMAFISTLFVTCSGYLDTSPEDPRTLKYFHSTFDIFVSWYNFIALLWIIQFVIGCQNMIIAGCVATWFFARDKNSLGTPILTSTKNLIKYHLGTVAFGSLIITIVQVIKSLISALRSAAEDSDNELLVVIWYCTRVCIECIETLLQYITRNAYIITAIYGYSFCVSGIRAFKLIKTNFFKIFVINTVGDAVLFFIHIFVVVLTVFVGVEIFRKNDNIQNLWFPLAIVGCISYFIAHCFLTVFEMAIDTIFVCFCEDCAHNDGLSKPYFMSRNLMEFIEKSNKIIKAATWNDAEQQAWDNGPKRVLQRAY